MRDWARRCADRQIAERMYVDRSLYRMQWGPWFFAVRDGREAVALAHECSQRRLEAILEEQNERR